MVKKQSTCVEVSIKEPSSPSIDLSHEVERIEIPTNVFLEIDPVPFQRNHEQRAKTKKVKDSLSILRVEHIDVQLAMLTKKSVYSGKTYPANSVFIVNGNTRKYFWENGLSDRIPEKVHATMYKVDSMEEIQQLYNSFDSVNAVEKNQEKIYGLLARVHNYTPTSSKISLGQFITALNLASFYYDRSQFNQPNVNAEIVSQQVSILFEEIKAFDMICTRPGNWDQALICAAFLALRVYGTKHKRLLEALEFINRRAGNMQSPPDQWDGVTHIVYEWGKEKPAKVFPSKLNVWEGGGGLKETTAWALYWLRKYISRQTQQQAGFNWRDTTDKMMDEHRNHLQTNVNLSTVLNLPLLPDNSPPKQDLVMVKVKRKKNKTGDLGLNSDLFTIEN